MNIIFSNINTPTTTNNGGFSDVAVVFVVPFSTYDFNVTVFEPATDFDVTLLVVDEIRSCLVVPSVDLRVLSFPLCLTMTDENELLHNTLTVGRKKKKVTQKQIQ
jgi:hypothetical protein